MISVIIPLYNKEQYISRAIQSVLDQTFQEFEIVIVNDGSTDNSVAEVEKFDDLRIRLIHQKNAGVSAARNRGIEEAKYELIAFLDADDKWLSIHLDEILELVVKYSECKIYATNYKVLYLDGTEEFPIDLRFLNIKEVNGILKNYFDVAIKTAPPLWTSAIVVNKKVIEKTKGFPLGVSSGEDLITWAKLACEFSIAYSKKVTSIYCVPQTATEKKPRRVPQEYDYVGEMLFALYKKYTIESLKFYIAHWHKMRFVTFLRLGNRKQAYFEFKTILKYTGWNIQNIKLLILTILPISVTKTLFFIRNKL